MRHAAFGFTTNGANSQSDRPVLQIDIALLHVWRTWAMIGEGGDPLHRNCPI
jgi:hypothetical protein